MCPDDSNGIYNVPNGTIVNSGDTVLPSQHNPWANDSATAISNRFSKDGRAPATGNWNLNTFRMTNVGDPVALGDATNKQYVDGEIETVSSDLLTSVGSALLSSDSLVTYPTVIALPVEYRMFRLLINGLNFSDGSSPYFMQLSVNGGTTWLNGASDYSEQYAIAAGSSGSFLGTPAQSAMSIILTSLNSGQRATAVIDIDPGSSGQYATILNTSKWRNAIGDLRRGDFVSQRNAIGRVNALQLFPGASGTIFTGSYALYGFL